MLGTRFGCESGRRGVGGGGHSPLFLPALYDPLGEVRVLPSPSSVPLSAGISFGEPTSTPVSTSLTLSDLFLERHYVSTHLPNHLTGLVPLKKISQGVQGVCYRSKSGSIVKNLCFYSKSDIRAVANATTTAMSLQAGVGVGLGVYPRRPWRSFCAGLRVFYELSILTLLRKLLRPQIRQIQIGGQNLGDDIIGSESDVNDGASDVGGVGGVGVGDVGGVGDVQLSLVLDDPGDSQSPVPCSAEEPICAPFDADMISKGNRDFPIEGIAAAVPPPPLVMCEGLVPLDGIIVPRSKEAFLKHGVFVSMEEYPETLFQNIVKSAPIPDSPYYKFDKYGRRLDPRIVNRKRPRPKHTVEESKMIIFELLRALNVLHSIGFIHLDVKPSNVVVDFRIPGNPRIGLIDFGLSKPIDGRGGEFTWMNLVTWNYRSPELAERGQMIQVYLTSARGPDSPVRFPARVTPYTPKADIWSVGCILFELVVGCQLFSYPGVRSSDNHRLRLEQVKFLQDPESRIVALSKIPLKEGPFGSEGSLLLDLLKGMLHKDPNQRLSAYDALQHDCFAGLRITRPVYHPRQLAQFRFRPEDDPIRVLLGNRGIRDVTGEDVDNLRDWLFRICSRSGGGVA